VAFGDLWNDQFDRPDAYTVWFRHYLRAHHDVIADWLKP
jgi:hypothetical protein